MYWLKSIDFPSKDIGCVPYLFFLDSYELLVIVLVLVFTNDAMLTFSIYRNRINVLAAGFNQLNENTVIARSKKKVSSLQFQYSINISRKKYR